MNAQQLKNSILQMAVQGKLVPQDPNDEPASILLERIRTEKEQMIKEGKIKKEKNTSVIFRGDDNLPYEKTGNGEPVCIADDVPFEIPDSWEWARMVNIFAIINGDRGKNYPSKSKLTSSGIPFISAINLNGESVTADENLLCLSEEQYSKLGSGKLQEDDIVICIRGSLGKHGRFPFKKGAIASSLVIARSFLDNEIITAYFMIFLDSPLFFREIKEFDNGTAQPNLSAKNLEQFLIPIPPIQEQRRMVKKFQSLLPFLDNYGIQCKNLNNCNDEFPVQLRKSILQQAVKGKLVPQDPNDEPASVLLERIRIKKEQMIKDGEIKRDKHESVIYRKDDSFYEEVGGVERCIDDEIPFEIPESWEWARLGSLSSVLGGKRIPAGRKLSQDDTGHIYIRVSDMKDGSVRTDSLLYVPLDIYPAISKYIINKEDIYITVAGTIGAVGKIPPELDGANLTENADRIVFSKIDQDWFICYLSSPFIQSEILRATTQVGQPKLAIKRIEKLLVALPPLNEQKNIVKELKSLITFINCL